MMRGERKATVPFAHGLPFGNPGEGGNSAEPDIVDPSPCLGDGGKQGVLAFGFHHWLCARLMNDALHGREAWRRPGKGDHGRQMEVGSRISEVARIAEYVMALKAAGWPRVRIVTDHVWLLMPGGFEAIRLPASTVIAKGCRAAILQEEAAAEIAFLPWQWDKSVRIAMPSGAQAFRAGEASIWV
jgi:hypothetical protein